MKDKEIFTLNKSTFSEITEKIHDKLSQTKATKKEVLRADLLLEETFMRMTEIGNAQSVSVSIHNRLGDLTLMLEAEGDEYNPLVEVTDYDENDEDYYRTLILKANRSKMSYTRKNNKNVVIIRVKDATNKQIYYTVAAMIFGVIFGAILKTAATPEIITVFNDTIAGSIETMFMNALNMMIAPVIFFSVISGITGLTNAADASRIGGKLIGLYSTTTIIASMISLILAYLLFSTGVPQIGIVEGEVSTAELSILSIIVGIIPKNLIDPIVNRELLQVIFVAVIFGVCINKLGDKVKLLNDFINAANSFCLKMIIMITAFIPLIAFTSMASLILTLGADSIFLLLKLIAGVLIGATAMIIVYCMLLTLIGRISPMPYLKKLPSFVTIPFATSSSNVTMPFTMKFCTEKLGISPKLSSFSIPLGTTINMDGTAIYYGMACMMILKMYNVEMDFNTFFTLLISMFTISIGASGVPGAVLSVAAILGVFGIPIEATVIILGVDSLIDRVNTALNVVGDIAATTTLASNENLIDKNIYLKKF